MPLIDLTNEGAVEEPLVGMVTRFPPSKSGSAFSAWRLSDALTTRHDLVVEVIRLVGPGEPPGPGYPVVMDLSAGWHLSPRLASQRLNRCQTVLVHVDRHTPLEVIDELLSSLEVPVILSLDDVPSSGTEQRRRVCAVAAKASITVVPSETARRRLHQGDSVPRRIEVISHGSPWKVFEPNSPPRRQVLSWGFLAPGFGAERIIRALGLLSDLVPAVHYRLVVITDPGWNRRESSSYRSWLLEQAERFGAEGQFEIVPRLHNDEELEAEIERSDLIAVVYDERDRGASRILTEAVATGRPVVATDFPAAVEMLSGGAGRTVSHDDDQELADALRLYLTDDAAYVRSARMASWLSPALSIDEAARRYFRLIVEVTSHGPVTAESVT